MQSSRLISLHQGIQSSRLISLHQGIQSSRLISPHQGMQISRLFSLHQCIQSWKMIQFIVSKLRLRFGHSVCRHMPGYQLSYYYYYYCQNMQIR